MRTVVVAFAALLILLSLTTVGISGGHESSRDYSADTQQSEQEPCFEYLEFTVVQNALGLDENQKKSIAEINKNIHDSAPDPDTVRNLPAHQREAVLHEWKTKAEQLKNKIGQSLNAAQMQRLKEIALQLGLKMRAGAILAQESLAKELSLTPEQKESLEKLHQNFRQRVNTARESLVKAGEKSGEITAEQAAKFRDEYRRLRNETYEKALGLLTAEQKEKLAELKGRIADIDIEQMLAEQSQRLEQWTKQLRQETLSREEQGGPAPAEKSSQDVPRGSQSHDSQSEQ